jgi:predicted nucleic-acid-binding Zn-ribbon protein
MYEDDDEDEDGDIFESTKFDECWSCKHRFCLATCNDCDYGENYEAEDMDEVDKDFVL